MCGIVAILAQNNISHELIDGLTLVQHRGQDAAGITCFDGAKVKTHKANGLVREVFNDFDLQEFAANYAIGHVRYPTQGSDSSQEAQPFYLNAPYGIALAHNGNLTNTRALQQQLSQDHARLINSNSDSEILLNILALAIEHNLAKTGAAKFFAAVTDVFTQIRGAYAVVSLIANQGLLAFRDPFGIRPLIVGIKDDAYMIASESSALTTLGYQVLFDLAPGEAVFIATNGELTRQQCAPLSELTPCIFEYVYLARPDSVIDGASVYRSRMAMGEFLAEKIRREHADLAIDVVIPIPETSRTAAHALARKLELPYREGFVKNHYIPRTFIMPNQELRKKSVRRKLSVIADEFAGKNVLLVDDSIVRGTTSKEIVKMVHEAGAKQVYFASAAPPVRYANAYGIDMPNQKDLIAYNKTEAEVAKYIGADALVYQDLADLIAAIRLQNPALKQFETSIFNGHYITKELDQEYLEQVAVERA